MTPYDSADLFEEGVANLHTSFVRTHQPIVSEAVDYFGIGFSGMRFTWQRTPCSLDASSSASDSSVGSRRFLRRAAVSVRVAEHRPGKCRVQNEECAHLITCQWVTTAKEGMQASGST